MNNNKFHTSSSTSNLMDIEKLLKDNNVTNKNLNNFIKVTTSLNEEKKDKLFNKKGLNKQNNKLVIPISTFCMEDKFK